MLLHFRIDKHFSFRLTRNPYPKFCQIIEAAIGGVLLKKVFLEISQNSQEKTCARDTFLNKIAGLRPATSLKKESLAQMFSCEFSKFLRTTFLQNTSGRLLLEYLRWGSLLRTL